jgi:hypothetical protein
MFDSLFEWARGETAASRCGLDFHETAFWTGYAGGIATGYVFSIPRNARLAAIEKR